MCVGNSIHAAEKEKLQGNNSRGLEDSRQETYTAYSSSISHALESSSDRVNLGLVTATKGSVQKRILADGSKDGNHSLSVNSGIYQNISVSGLHGLSELIQGIGANQALTLGTADRDTELNLYTKAVYEQLPDKSGAIARTKDCVRWSKGDRFIVFDHDPEPGKPDLSADEFWLKNIDVLPELAGVGRLTTTSTSSGIYNRATGECLRPENGHHTYIVVRGDIERFVEIYKHRCWLTGEAFYKLAKPNKDTGVRSILERFLSDTAVFSPERFVYEAGASLPDGLEQRRSAPRVTLGSVLDLGAIPELTAKELAQAEANQTAARKRIEWQQLKKATKAIKATGHPQPKAEAKRRISLANARKLAPHHILQIAGGGTLRVEDIGLEHDGLLLKDPQEPDYRKGAQVARLYWNGDRPWQIHSEAHGGCNYSAAVCVSPKNTHITEFDTSAADAEAERVEAAQEKESSLQQVISRFARIGKKATTEFKGFAPRPPAPAEDGVIEFEPGARLGTIQQATEKGWKHILDVSGTGSGKSTFVGETKADQLGVEKLIYLTKESRKPSTPGIEKNYTPLPVRNGGMFRDTEQFTPLGRAVVRHPKKGERADIKGNCGQPELFHKYAALGIDVQGEGNPICMGCSQQGACKAVDGWFKNDRRVALSHSQIISHPQSLNSPGSFEYGGTGLVWEESGELIQYRDEMEVGQADLDQTIGAIADDYPALHQQLSPISKALRALMNTEQPGRFGWNDAELFTALPQLEQPALDKLQNAVGYYYQHLQDTAFLENVTKANTSELTKAIASYRGKIERRQGKVEALRSQLNDAEKAIATYQSAELFGTPPTAAQLNDAENIPSKIRALEVELSDLQTALEADERERANQVTAAQDANTEQIAEKHKSLEGSVQKRWLHHFLSTLSRERGYSFRMQNGRLTLSFPVTRYQDIAETAKFNLHLDATLSRKRLAQMLNIPENQILVIRQKGTGDRKPTNLRVIQIADGGKFGRQRSEGLKARVAALIAHVQQQHPGAGIIDYKSADSKHYWFRDNRGSNEFQHAPALLTIGTPCPNLTSLEADYIALTGDRPTGKDDPNWQAFCTTAIDNEFVQAAGRPRAQHRPTEQITWYIASNHPLPAELEAEQVRARDICIEAATPAEQQWQRISQALSELGNLPKQAELSSLLGIAQGQISKLASLFCGGWNRLKKIFQTLIETNKANGIFLELPESEQQQAIEQTELLESIAESPPDPGDDTPAFLVELAEAIGLRQFAIAASQMSPLNRGRLLEKLLLSPDFEGWEAIA